MNAVIQVSNRAKAISFVITFALQLAVCSAYYEYNVTAISTVSFVCFMYPAHTSLHFFLSKTLHFTAVSSNNERPALSPSSSLRPAVQRIHNYYFSNLRHSNNNDNNNCYFSFISDRESSM